MMGLTETLMSQMKISNKKFNMTFLGGSLEAYIDIFNLSKTKESIPKMMSELMCDSKKGNKRLLSHMIYRFSIFLLHQILCYVVR